MTKCHEIGIEQNLIRPKTLRTNGKAERVIRTIMEQLSGKTEFRLSAHRKNGLKKVRELLGKAPQGMGNLTPVEKLLEYFYPEKLYTTFRILTSYMRENTLTRC